MNKHNQPNRVPFAVYCDDEGNLFEDPSLEAIGRSGSNFLRLKPDDFIELPDGSDFFFLKDRIPLGFDAENNKIVKSNMGHAAAAFIAPAYTQTYLSAFERTPESPVLPLYAYSVLGWLDDKFYTTALRIDPDKRQDCSLFDQHAVERNAMYKLKKNKKNRLLKHLSHCALEYMCPAARNYFLYRWEAPLPTSPTCNSRCLGCISYQPKSHGIVSTQNRITFIPTPDEIAEIAVPHLDDAPLPIVSFGQGCEGEPLMVWETLRDSIKLIRSRTQKGIVNLNTNGSNPKAVEELCKAGIDSFRFSMNSVRKEVYEKYYQPKGYSFDNVLESIAVARKYNKWVSVNYFVFPGITDSRAESEALRNLLATGNINMIQWRNFNIDPDWFIESLSLNAENELIGVKKHIESLKKDFPDLYHGYFNPPSEIINKYKK